MGGRILSEWKQAVPGILVGVADDRQQMGDPLDVKGKRRGHQEAKGSLMEWNYMPLQNQVRNAANKRICAHFPTRHQHGVIMYFYKH